MEARPECPTKTALEFLEGKWKSRILYELMLSSPKRYREIKRGIPGISDTMLSSGLRELEGRGLITRRQFDEIPPRVEYSLDEGGRALASIFYSLGQWGERYLR